MRHFSRMSHIDHHIFCLEEIERVPKGWSLWVQDGPSTEVLLVNEKIKCVIGEGIFPKQMEFRSGFFDSLEDCDWCKIWDFDQEP